MRVRNLLWLPVLVGLIACTEFGAVLKERLADSPRPLDATTAAAGLREALEQGAVRAVRELGRENGFFRHPQLKIPMPEKLARIEKGLRQLGQERVADEFVLSLNRAAEAAVPEARAVLVEAIRGMSIEDALGIVRGGEDAATRYFRARTEQPLGNRFRPIVAAATERVGVTRRYKKFVDQSGPLARLMDTRELDLDQYVTARALDGLFALIGEEERRIRADPLARTSELLRTVFR